MATIGSFTPTSEGYVGTIRTLTINTKAKFLSNPHKTTDNAPDYRVMAGPTQLGAAWIAQTSGDEPREFISVVLDDPSFSAPIRAALFENDDAAYLVWNRNKRQG